MAVLSGHFPLIVDIKRGSLEDGPGIRSVVFFKGCPLRCVFCHNPETQEQYTEIAFSAKDCIGCGRCKEVCPKDAIFLPPHQGDALPMEEKGKETSLPFKGSVRPALSVVEGVGMGLIPGERINRDKCNRCGECVKVCPGQGLRDIGSYYEVEELTEILLRDISFYRHSGGGVTLSGGECTMYPDYLGALLKNLKARNIHTALETAGYFEYSTFKRKILPYTDMIYYDIKIADKDDHERFIGRSNQKIIDNLRLLIKEESVEVIPRVPLIPGISSTQKNLSAIVNLLCDIGADNVSLLPYNPMGMEMYEKLGRQKPLLQETFMEPDEEKEVYDMFQEILAVKI